MRTNVLEKLFFGNESDCTHSDSDALAVVHACKDPCHRRAVGYVNTLPRDHAHYLVRESGHHLCLNMIDPPAPLFMLPTFVAFMAFVDREIAERDVLIHCNQGQSRAPSLALLYMAKRGHLPNASYADAAQAFRGRHPYSPGAGISKWLTVHWAAVA